jgi:FMN-dependent oxidoreductase (nitrilotriacetate monooxygenase family)
MMHLNVSTLTPGSLNAVWRLPHVDPEAFIDISHYIRLARIAEDASVDALFFGDVPTIPDDIAEGPRATFDPLVLASALASATEKVGFVCTTSTSFNEPYNVARRFNSLDHLSNGRVAVNLVSTQSRSAAANFSSDGLPDAGTRYRRAGEFAQVLEKLWGAWDADALVADRSSGVFVDRARVHDINFSGEFFSVRGPLPLPRSPQVRPMIVQAGGSEEGLDLASRHADVVFFFRRVKEHAKQFRQDMRERAVAVGRHADSIKVSMGVVVMVADTAEEARRRQDEYNAMLPLDVLGNKVLTTLGLKAGSFGIDDVLTFEDLPEVPRESAAPIGVQEATRALLKDKPHTVRELVYNSAGGFGSKLIVGTGKQVADELAEWYEAGCTDGFTILPADTSVDFKNFCELVVPILKERGLFHSEYPAGTMRDRYGVTTTSSIFAAPNVT